MIIHVGSTNPAKLKAVEELTREYHLFWGAKVIGVEVDSQVSPQPRGLEETVLGAMNRAKNAFFGECKYSIGIEGGCLELLKARGGIVNMGVVSIYDGKEHSLGLTSGFEYPTRVIRELDEGRNLSEAFVEARLSGDKNIGKNQGAVRILTKGRLNRTSYVKQALTMAMIYIENPHLRNI